MLRLPSLIEELSDKGCTDIDAIMLATDLVKIELLKDKFGQELDGEKLNAVIQESNQVRDQEKATFSMINQLSNRERECYLLYSTEAISMSKIAFKLGITKASVQTYINRAKEKLTNNLQ